MFWSPAGANAPTGVPDICNCPDAKSHAKTHHCLCKHICFIIFKVLKNTVDKSTTQLFKNHYLFQDEKEKVLEKINNLNINDDNDFVNKEYIQKYEKLKNIDPKKLFSVKKEFDMNDECPICYDALEEKNKCVQCPACNNILHNICINKWLNVGNTNCPYCRSESWENYNNEHSYINLDIN